MLNEIYCHKCQLPKQRSQMAAKPYHNYCKPCAKIKDREAKKMMALDEKLTAPEDIAAGVRHLSKELRSAKKDTPQMAEVTTKMVKALGGIDKINEMLAVDFRKARGDEEIEDDGTFKTTYNARIVHDYYKLIFNQIKSENEHSANTGDLSQLSEEDLQGVLFGVAMEALRSDPKFRRQVAMEALREDPGLLAELIEDRTVDDDVGLTVFGGEA